MKIRNGFVSNSSTSSFCIYGTEIGSDEYEKIENYLREHNQKTFLDLECGPECHYIGKEWCDINDDETGRQFKTRIQAEIIRLFQLTNMRYDLLKCNTHSEAWYNG